MGGRKLGGAGTGGGGWKKGWDSVAYWQELLRAVTNGVCVCVCVTGFAHCGSVLFAFASASFTAHQVCGSNISTDGPS